MSWPSGHLGQLKPPGNVRVSTNTSGMTLWHAGTLVAHLACWHSRQTHGTGNQTNDDTPLSQSGKTLLTHTDDVVSLQVDDGVYGDDLDDISELDQAVNQSILRKLAQPHKPKNPNFEIWTILIDLVNLDNLIEFMSNFDNFDNFGSFKV